MYLVIKRPLFFVAFSHLSMRKSLGLLCFSDPFSMIHSQKTKQAGFGSLVGKSSFGQTAISAGNKQTTPTMTIPRVCVELNVVQFFSQTHLNFVQRSVAFFSKNFAKPRPRATDLVLFGRKS